MRLSIVHSAELLCLRVHMLKNATLQTESAVVTVPSSAFGVAGMTNAFAFRTHKVQKRVLLAVHTHLNQFEEVARFLALDP